MIALVGAAILLAATALGEAGLADTGRSALSCWADALSALLAGAVVPWTRAGAGGQAATLGAFGVVAGLAASCAGRLSAPFLPRDLPVSRLGRDRLRVRLVWCRCSRVLAGRAA